MFVCNEERQKRYLKERRQQELNDEVQQEVIDNINAERLGLETQARTLSRLGKAVFTDLIENTTTPVEKQVVSAAKKTLLMSNPTIADFVKNAKLSELFDNIKKINPQFLSKKARIIQKDLSNEPMIKETVNEMISQIISDINTLEEEKPAQIEKELINIVAGGDKKVMQELITKSRSSSMGSDDSFFSSAPTVSTLDTMLGSDKKRPLDSEILKAGTVKELKKIINKKSRCIWRTCKNRSKKNI